MATRNIVPRADGEGSLGTYTKKWGAVYAEDIHGDVTGNVEGTASGNLPMVVGAVLPFAGNTLPDGWLLCDGSAVDRTLYAALFNVIGTTYGSGDGSTTFNVPNLTNKFIEGSATSGTVKTAGLPDITGWVRPSILSLANAVNDVGSGVFSSSGQTDTSKKPQIGGAGGSYFNLKFNASNSNAIYGNSSTVQPPSLTMRYIIKY